MIFNTFATEYPISCGVTTGITHGILQGLVMLRFQNEDSPFLQQTNQDSNALQSTADSSFEKIILSVQAIGQTIFIPLGWELLFRDTIYTYVESNFASAKAINFIMMPILYGALHFDPRLDSPLLMPASNASLGFFLALLRETTGGISSTLAANMANSVAFSTIIGFDLARKLHQAKTKAASASTSTDTTQ